MTEKSMSKKLSIAIAEALTSVTATASEPPPRPYKNLESVFREKFPNATTETVTEGESSILQVHGSAVISTVHGSATFDTVHGGFTITLDSPRTVGRVELNRNEEGELVISLHE